LIFFVAGAALLLPTPPLFVAVSALPLAFAFPFALALAFALPFAFPFPFPFPFAFAFPFPFRFPVGVVTSGRFGFVGFVVGLPWSLGAVVVVVGAPEPVFGFAPAQ
jgi:hypothetical protein